MLLQLISVTLLGTVCSEKFPLKNFSLIFHLLCKQEPCQRLSWSVFSVISSLFMLHPFCLRCIPARYVIPPDFVSANPLASMETINQFSTFWGMTYRRLLWRGRTGHDRKVLQQSDKDEEVLLQMKIVKGKKLQISLLPREVCDLGFSLSPPSHSWINFQLGRAKSTLGPETKLRASKVIQDNAVKNESPEGLYFHYEPPPNKEQVCFSVEEPWNKDL